MMLPARPSRFRLVPRLIVCAVVLYAFVWISGFPHYYDDEELPVAHREKTGKHKTPYPVEYDYVVVSVKTSATEAYAKIPPMLVLTKQLYYDSLLLMGDLRMDIGAFHIEDVLDRYNMDFVAHTPDLDRYGRQMHQAREGLDLATLVEEDRQREKEVQAKLDKFKILRMLERAWELRPERRWYIFVDTDTHLVRANLHTWLGQFDPEVPYFFANPPARDTADPYSIGGHTFIVSVKVLRNLFVDRDKVINRWDPRISDFSSAYDVLSATLSTELSISPNLSWPGITGFHPLAVPYGPGFWCEPVVAMDFVPAEGRSDLWRFERDREEVQHILDPMNYAELWTHFLQSEDLNNARDDWDNQSSGPEYARWNILFERIERRDHAQEHLNRRSRDDGQDGQAPSGEDAWEACRESCNRVTSCVQWSFSSMPTPNYNENGETRCHLSRSMRIGEHVEPRDTEVNGVRGQLRWRSGWRKDRFEKWAQHQRCKGQQNKN